LHLKEIDFFKEVQNTLINLLNATSLFAPMKIYFIQIFQINTTMKKTKNSIQLLATVILLFFSSCCYSQSTFDFNDPNIIYKDVNGRIMTKDSLMAFVSKGSFTIKKNEIGNGKTEITLYRKTQEENEKESILRKEKLNKLLGTAFPSFDLRNISGTSMTEKDLAGKVTVVNFWFTGCQPCIREMPELNRLTKNYKSVNFVAFTFNDMNAVKKFLLKRNFDYSQIPDANELIKALDINTYPTHMILDRNGIVKEIEFGATDDIYKRLESLIDKELQ
jgi:thiol-disulfide isomerase/thioredoxin